jgi:hypothetical protein
MVDNAQALADGLYVTIREQYPTLHCANGYDTVQIRNGGPHVRAGDRVVHAILSHAYISIAHGTIGADDAVTCVRWWRLHYDDAALVHKICRLIDRWLLRREATP